MNESLTKTLEEVSKSNDVNDSMKSLNLELNSYFALLLELLAESITKVMIMII